MRLRVLSLLLLLLPGVPVGGQASFECPEIQPAVPYVSLHL